MEFSDFRPYMPGDDLRRVDKRSFASQEQLYTKVYLEEKQAMVHLLLDASASMEGEKFWTASVLAASVAYVAMKRNDRVKLFVFSDGVTKVFQSGQGQTNFPSLVEFLEQISCGGKTDLLRAAVQSIPRPKEGICYVFSDGFSQDDPAKALQRLSHARQKLHLVQVLTPEEAAPKMLGDFRLTDRETELLELLTRFRNNHEIAEALQVRGSTLQKHFQNMFRKLGVTSRWEVMRLLLELDMRS